MTPALHSGGDSCRRDLPAVLRHHILLARLELLVGGGVRDLADLLAARAAGAAGALVGTALHSGAIARSEIARLA